MSNTDELRAAAQQALMALVHHTEQTRPIQRTADAIAALRAALAQPAASGEPVAWRITQGARVFYVSADEFRSSSYDYGEMVPLYTAQPAASGEPVAQYLGTNGGLPNVKLLRPIPWGASLYLTAAPQPAPVDHTPLLRMLAQRARSFPNFPIGAHIPEVFSALGENRPDWQAPQPAPVQVRPIPDNVRAALCQMLDHYGDDPRAALVAFWLHSLPSAPQPAPAPAPIANRLALQCDSSPGGPYSVTMTFASLQDAQAAHRWVATGAQPAPARVTLTECNTNDSPWLICKTCAAAGRCARATSTPPMTADQIERHIGVDEGDREAVTAIVREVEAWHGITAQGEPK